VTDNLVVVSRECCLAADDSAPHEAKLMAVAGVTEVDRGARLFESFVRDVD